jgi:N-dimethylarginine dimethylaminohydrolase
MITSHAEYGPIKTLLLKHARDAFRSQELITRQWKELNFLSEPELPKAASEYSAFHDLVTGEGLAQVTMLPQDASVTLDSLYCRDAALATDFGMIMCNMGKPARAGEPAAIKRACDAASITVLGEIKAPGTVEGGDCAWVDVKTLAVGLTYRTNAHGIAQLRAMLEPHGVKVIDVHLPHFRGVSDVFHLMSIFSPVHKDIAVVYSPLMPIVFRNDLLTRGFNLVEVPESEFDSMGCNVLAIGNRHCLMVKGNPITRERLEAAGCKVDEYEGQEISLKGGGGPTCLTRPMQREI